MRDQTKGDIIQHRIRDIRAGAGETLRALIILLGTAFEVDFPIATALTLLMLLERLAEPLLGLWLKHLADAILIGDLTRLTVATGALTFTFGITLVAAWTHVSLQLTLAERIQVFVDDRLAAITAGVTGLEHFERPDYLNTVELLRRQRQLLGLGSNYIVALITSLAGLAVIIWLLFQIHPVLILLPVLTVFPLVSQGYAVRLRMQALDYIAEPSRLSQHLFALVTDARTAKEIRVFDAGPELIRRYQQLQGNIYRVLRSNYLAGIRLTILGWIVFIGGYLGALLLVTTRAINGDATPGDVLLTLTLAGQINELMAGTTQLGSAALTSLSVARRYVWLNEYARATARWLLRPTPVPKRLTHGITLQHVSFAYPGTNARVLDNINLHLPAGAVVALVGENGAGKTTLVKLLCRFYEPQEGQILVDRVDLSHFDPTVWRERSSGAFQDFARFEFRLREAVGVGDLSQIENTAAVLGALNRAGAADLIGVLPAGLGTQLGQTWADGIDLSQGQWQKVALGRAMMRKAPLLLVLDEPTASLDAETEHVLFERYADAARQNAESTGTITLLISHRFSTVYMADLIVVLSRGRIVETGSHKELIAFGGLYADLYELQARMYR